MEKSIAEVIKLTEFLRKLRLEHGLPESALIAKVVHSTGNGGWGLLRPLGKLPEIKIKDEVFFDTADLDEQVPEKRLYLEQIVAYCIDPSSKRGPRAVEIVVLHDPGKADRLAREAKYNAQPASIAPISRPIEIRGPGKFNTDVLYALGDAINARCLTPNSDAVARDELGWKCRGCSKEFTSTLAAAKEGKGCAFCAVAVAA